MPRENELTKLILIVIGIPLFLGALVGILNGFQDKMNVVDTLVTDVAPNLPPHQGDFVRVLALGLFLFFCIALPVSIEAAARKFLG